MTVAAPCADTRAGFTGPPWNIFPPAADVQHTHYPIRHNGGFVTLRHDGSSRFRIPRSLKDEDFLADVTP